MRKILIALALIITVGFVVSQAWAWGGGRYGQGRGFYGNGGRHMANVDPQAYGEFMNNTADLRKQLAQKRVEYQTLMAQPDPQQDQVAQLRQEMTDLQAQIQDQAPARMRQSWGRGQGICPMGNNCPMGGGPRHGRHGRGPHHGYGW
ncbi:MAG: periplasmic heavy metal sensor [Thermodesulfobacteriota bacterium]